MARLLHISTSLPFHNALCLLRRKLLHSPLSFLLLLQLHIFLILTRAPFSFAKPEPIRQGLDLSLCRARKKDLDARGEDAGARAAMLSPVPTFDFVDTKGTGHLYTESELVEWRPKPNKYMLALCHNGGLSNQMKCISKYVYLSALLNRTLVIPRYGVEGDRNDWWRWSQVLDLPRVQRCLAPAYGSLVLLSLDDFMEIEAEGSGEGRAKQHVLLDRLFCLSYKCWNKHRVGLVRRSLPEIRLPSRMPQLISAIQNVIPAETHKLSIVPRTTQRFVQHYGTAAPRLISFGDVYFSSFDEVWWKGKHSRLRPPLKVPVDESPSCSSISGQGISSSSSSSSSSRSSISASNPSAGSGGDDGSTSGTGYSDQQACSCRNMWHPVPAIRNFVEAALRHYAGPSLNYMAAHVRRGDFKQFLGSQFMSLADIARSIIRVSSRYNLTVIYVATDAKGSELGRVSNVIRRHVGPGCVILTLQSIVTESKKITNPAFVSARQAFLDLWKKEKLAFAIADRYFCVHARAFLGTEWSTYSRAVLFDRTLEGTQTCADGVLCKRCRN